MPGTMPNMGQAFSRDTQSPCESVPLLTSIPQTNHLSLIEVKELAQGHPSGNVRAGIPTQGLSASEV